MSGTLFYLIGASGSGKDSLLAGCRERLSPDQHCCVAHRYITRAPGVGGENHVQLSPEEFQMRDKFGLFAMQWQSHGYRYGIGSEINGWLDRGLNVLVNGSREYLPQALAQYDELVPVLVDVNADLLRNRLLNRGRESTHEIEHRLARHQQLVNNLDAEMESNLIKVDNSGALDQGIDHLLDVIKHYSWHATA